MLPSATLRRAYSKNAPNLRPRGAGLETIFSRDQHILDEWWRREIDAEELQQRIRFDLDWGYDWGHRSTNCW
jgi:hypothetical protein